MIVNGLASDLAGRRAACLPRPVMLLFAAVEAGLA